ncbi:MAG: alanine--tRNA ligase-related protein, partial [Gammaproteobacteria bacterium]|nr:alanine--tRNA ligase-related protein [Gammaproteobacteria bacterium]
MDAMMSATSALFRADAYGKTAEAEVLAITTEGHLILDQTLFYPNGGGQPGDRGLLLCAGKVDTE